MAKTMTPDTGYFWFFNEANVEVVVKVLHGCPVNDRIWVFAGGLTNVGAEIRVEDTESPAAKVYGNPLGMTFQPIQDTAAFEGCDGGGAAGREQPRQVRHSATGERILQ